MNQEIEYCRGIVISVADIDQRLKNFKKPISELG
jgi:hypothetical protein